MIQVTANLVYAVGGTEPYFQTRQADPYSRIGWDGSRFSVLDDRGDRPVTSVLWHGAAAYSNWLSSEQGYQPCYDTTTWECNFSRSGYRLPTEAEWEYAGRGGQYNPYYIFPRGDAADGSRANWPGSGDPYESGSLPWTTPVGFYNGQLRQKSDFGWPGNQQAYQTSDGANAYGLYDMAGNVWQWCNDWDGNLVWEFEYSTSQYKQHHDIKPLPNGNILMLVVEKKTYEEAIAAGFDPAKFQPQVQQEGYMLPDSVVEIQPARPSGGTVVWSWHVWDHLVQDYSTSKANYGSVAAHPELVNANGNYPLIAGQAFGPEDFAWTYTANPPGALYAEAISSAQRLPNGNTLICDGTHGTFLEVVPGGETVWKYVNPVVLDGPLTQGAAIPADPAREGEYMNAVFRVRRYAPDYPGFAGRDLTPGGTVELNGYSHSLYFPHVSSDGTWETEISLINTGDTQTVTGILRAFANEGRQLHTAQISLAPHARREMTVGELAGARQIGYIAFESDSEDLAGNTKFYIPGKYRAGVPAVTATDSGDIYLSHIASDGFWWTGASLVNTRPFSREVKIEFDNGETRTLTMGAMARSALLIRDLFGGQPQPSIHSAVLSDASGIIGLELFGSHNQLDAIPITSEASTTVYYPHIAADFPWLALDPGASTAGIAMVNPTSENVSAQLTGYDSSGNTAGISAPLQLSSQGQIDLQADARLGMVRTVNAWVKAEFSNPGVQGFFLARLFPKDRLTGMDGAPMIPATTLDGIIPRAKTDGGYATQLAVSNPGDTEVSVSIVGHSGTSSCGMRSWVFLYPRRQLDGFS